MSCTWAKRASRPTPSTATCTRPNATRLSTNSVRANCRSSSPAIWPRAGSMSRESRTSSTMTRLRTLRSTSTASAAPPVPGAMASPGHSSRPIRALPTAIELFINTEIPKLEYPTSPGPIPQGVLASRELDSKRLEVAKQFNRFAASAPGAVGHVASPSPEEADPTRFPGGVVPKGLPPKRMMGRVKTARSMKATISQTFMPKPDHPPPQSPPMSNRSP